MIHRIFRSPTNLFLGLAIAFAGVTSALAANGSLDQTFGTGGKVTTDFGIHEDFGRAIALQPDGKIIVAGGSTAYRPCCKHDFGLARYNSNGSLDTSFDTDGKVITDFGNASTAYAVILQPDGKLVAAGGGNIARYNPDGSLDTTFDTDGKVTDFGSSGVSSNAVALQPDGRIVVAGLSNNNFALARYNSNGSLDTSFDTDGRVTTDFGSSDTGFALALQPDGRIVVAGDSYSYDYSNSNFALARYNNNGSLDTSFDTDGKVTTDFGNGDSARAVAIQLDGKIVVAGSSDNGSNFDFVLARYNSDGSLDTTFDMDGKVTPDFGSNIYDGANAIAIQQGGKIVVAGRSGGGADFALRRYNSDGSLDITFDTDGKVTTSIGSGEDYGHAIALASNGKIVVAGSSFNGIDFDFALARYLTTPAPGAATLMSPSGAITDTTPAYTWNKVNVSTWYYLWVSKVNTDGSLTTIHNKWYESSSVCSGSTCSFTPADALTSGNYRWWIQTWNEGGYGPWSSEKNFNLSTIPLSVTATLVSPSGAITNTTPTYMWNKVSASTWYYLWVSKLNSDNTLSTVHAKWYEASTVCGSSTCSFTPTDALTSGNYRWWIQTWNEGGYGAWSNFKNFSLPVIPLPVAATLVSPSGSTTNTTPAYTWNKVNTATWYYLWVSRVNGDGSLTTVHAKWYDSSLVCGASTCSITPSGVTLSSGNYRWWIQTWNDGGYGSWTSAMNFTVSP